MVILAAQGDPRAIHDEGGVPGDLDGVLDALVRGASLGMEAESTLGRLAGSRRHREIVVDVDGLDANGPADADDPPSTVAL